MVKSSILLLTTPFRPNIGGVETHLDDLLKEGVKKDYDFVVLTYQPLITKAWGKSIEKAKGLVVYRIPWIRMNLFLILEKYPALEFLYLFPALFIAGLILMMFKGSNIKIIHAQGLVAGAVGVILSSIFDKKIIISTHSIYNFPTNGIYRNFVKYLVNKAEKILTLSNQSKEEIQKLVISKEKVAVFRYWVDQGVFKAIKKETAREKLNLPSNFICLFVGRLVAVKGIGELLKAAKLLEEECTFLIIGDGPLATQVREAESKMQNIIFRESIENKELPLYYNAANVLIIPSTHEEGFGRVILEALSCGVPVIGSDRGAIPDVISKEVGIIIKITPLNITKILKLFIKNPTKLDKMAKSARNFALKKYNAKNLKLITRYYE
jgi:glycosyltransferase involved in cell wall biosynthesis